MYPNISSNDSLCEGESDSEYIGSSSNVSSEWSKDGTLEILLEASDSDPDSNLSDSDIDPDCELDSGSGSDSELAEFLGFNLRFLLEDSPESSSNLRLIL